MITEVVKLDDGVWVINETVKVYNLTVEDNGEIYCDIDFNEKVITAKEASELADELISRAVKAKIDEAESENN